MYYHGTIPRGFGNLQILNNFKSMFHHPIETQLPSIKRSFYEKKGISDQLESLSGQEHIAIDLT